MTPKNTELSSTLRFGFQASNNEAEYEAPLIGLRWAKEMEAEMLEIYSDSQLIVNQVKSEYQAKEDKMMEYLGKVKDLLESFIEYTMAQISKEENSKANAFTMLASATDTSLTKFIPMKFLSSSSINEKESGKVSLVAINGSWMDPIIDYLKNKRLPNNKQDARRIRLRSAREVILADVFYKRGYSLPTFNA